MMAPNVEGLRSATFSVLKRIPETDLHTVTLPVLREQVATHLGVNQDALRDGESKKVLMDCFQQHLVEQSAVVTKKNDTVEGSSDGDDLIDEPVSRRKKKSPSKPTVRAKTASAKPKQKTSAGKSAGEAQLERLKSYVFKCGVRKIWKRELDGLNQRQSLDRLHEILAELGMEGRPTLEKCKEVKRRLEFEAEMREINPSNIVEGKRRSLSAVGSTAKQEKRKRRRVAESDSDSDDSTSSASSVASVASASETESDPPLDLAAYGDPESDSS